MKSDLDGLIEYILSNYKFGSEINERVLNDLFNRYSIDVDCKQDIYSELESLEITLIPEDDKNEIIIDYHFLDDIEFDDLDDILEGDQFKEDISNLVEVIDKKYNNDYLEEYINSGGNLEKRMHSLESLLSANKNLVWKLALKYRHYSTTSFDVEDMYQVGMIGLMKAVERFNFDKGTKFSTYATYWIMQSITRSICDYSTTIRLPVHIREKVNKFTRLENKLLVESEYKLNDDDLAFQFECTTKEVNQLRRFRSIANLTSLSVSVGEDGDSTLGDFIEDKSMCSPEQAFDKVELRNSIEKVCNTALKPKEMEIIYLRFGLVDEKVHTLEEVGKMYNVTRERIRQIEVKALAKLRKNKIKNRLGDFLYDSR